MDPSEPIAILLVDDRRENLIALTGILTRPEHRLLTASTGKEALRIALRERLAVILLDVVMPDLDGFEVARTLKQLDRTRDIPILFLTAHATDVRQIYRAYDAGAVDYLVKPLDPEVVRKKVGVFVSLARQRQQIEEQAQQLVAVERREHELRIAELKVANESRYRKLVEGIDRAIAWTADEKGTLTFISRRAPRILGVPPDAFSRPGFWDKLVYPDDRAAVAKVFSTVLATHHDASLEHRLVGADGRVRWFHTSVSGESDSGGPPQLHGVSIEITEIKHGEAVQSLLADVGSILSASLDVRAELPAVAARVVPFLGDWCVIDEIVAGDAVRQIAAHAVPERASALAKLERCPHAIELDEPELHADPDPASLARALGVDPEHGLEGLEPGSYLILPMQARGGMLGIMFLGTSAPRRFGAAEELLAEQVSRRAALCMENTLLYEEAQRATRAREELLAVVSHDLRNPLNAISMSAKALARAEARKMEPEWLHRQVQTMVRSTELMERLIHDLLDFARSESGQLSLERTPNDAARLLADSAELLGPLAAQKGIHLEVGHAEAISVSCDRDRVLDVLSNLIGNAIKFTPSGGSVEVRVERLRDEARFAIIDTGPGIPPEHVPRVFERFWRANKTANGLGLGLAICKRLIDAHSGSIWAESTLGKGTTFYFTLPLAPAPGAEDDYSPARERPAEHDPHVSR